MLRLWRSSVRTDLSVKLRRRKEKSTLILLSHLRPKKLTATVSDKWVVKMEKTLSLYNILRTKAPPYSQKLYYSTLSFFFTVHCLNCSILLSFIAVHLFVHLIYKLNLIIECMYRKEHSIDRVPCLPCFRHLLGSLGHILKDSEEWLQLLVVKPLLATLSWASRVALVIKNPPANVGDMRDIGFIPGLGKSPGGGHGNPLQYSCLENPINREA